MKPYHNLTKRGQIARLERLADEALRGYDIGKVTMTPLEHMANTTFRLDAEDARRYVIRIQNPSSGQHTCAFRFDSCAFLLHNLDRLDRKAGFAWHVSGSYKRQRIS